LDGLVGGLEVAVDVDAELPLGQVPDVAHAGLHDVARTQDLVDGLRLGGRLDDHDGLAPGSFLRGLLSGHSRGDYVPLFFRVSRGAESSGAVFPIRNGKSQCRILSSARKTSSTTQDRLMMML